MKGTGYSTANTQFSGFGAAATTNNLVHSVDGADANANLTVGPVAFIGEYMTANERFSPQDLTFDGKGALPSAEHAEMDYTPPCFPKKYATVFGASYDHAAEALALNLEENKYAVFVNTSLLRETQESLEYNYQTDYGTNDTATGRGGPTSIVGTGKGINTIIGQVSVFF